MLGINIKSVSWKIMVMFVILTIITVATFVFLVFENQMDLIKDNALAEGEGIAHRVKIDVEKMMTDLDISDEKELVSSMRQIFNSLGVEKFSLLTESGKVIGEARESSAAEWKFVTKAIYKFNFENKFFYHNILKASNEIEFYIPISYGKKTKQLLVLKPVLKMEITEKLNSLYRQCLLVAIFVVIIYFLFVMLLSKLVVNPIKSLNLATIKISEGDFQTKVEHLDERDDEIGALATTFNKMGEALELMREEARDANPLTHLPGNAIITREINNRIKDNIPFAVIYIDLDNFKAYNDKYGFTMGDEAIFYLCENIKKTIDEVGDEKEDFTGHEGGDDFVMIVNPDRMEDIASTLIRYFDEGVKRFYNEEDAAQGFIMSVSRDGVKKQFPFMSISLAIVTNQHRHFVHHSEVVKVAAEMKKKVKAVDGSAYLIDRRKQ